MTPPAEVDKILAVELRQPILKSRDITLPTNVHLVKAMVFPVVMCRCESWIMKAEQEELMLLNCGAGEDS